MSSALTNISGNLATGTGLGDDGTPSTAVVVRQMSLTEIRVAKTDTGGSIAKVALVELCQSAEATTTV
jgi:hypothetical protein